MTSLYLTGLVVGFGLGLIVSGTGLLMYLVYYNRRYDE